MLQTLNMNRKWKIAVALGAGFVLAFVAALALHSLVGALIVLLSTVALSYVVGISLLRTAPIHRARRKQGSEQ